VFHGFSPDGTHLAIESHGRLLNSGRSFAHISVVRTGDNRVIVGPVNASKEELHGPRWKHKVASLLAKYRVRKNGQLLTLNTTENKAKNVTFFAAGQKISVSLEETPDSRACTDRGASKLAAGLVKKSGKSMKSITFNTRWLRRSGRCLSDYTVVQALRFQNVLVLVLRYTVIGKGMTFNREYRVGQDSLANKMHSLRVLTTEAHDDCFLRA